MPTRPACATDDTVIPLAHSLAAHDRLPSSRLEVFERTGHFPHSERPAGFTEVLLDFLHTTRPVLGDTDTFRRRLVAERPRPTPAIVPV
ncbi:alpha/beta hydrolase [Pseudonocardia sp. RS11V-5]|uniref:alpha/beta fold hydrolase n=1 Tax=Pseudonocardia terrae TaxID=2905831 RepID=UPI001E2D75A2|nr:alpha/beta hydrolase [Pseudonocardia terrae]MCE3554880.1 alpha/beta hydrolase [Pseudonocardia terrae]